MEKECRLEGIDGASQEWKREADKCDMKNWNALRKILKVYEQAKDDGGAWISKQGKMTYVRMLLPWRYR